MLVPEACTIRDITSYSTILEIVVIECQLFDSFFGLLVSAFENVINWTACWHNILCFAVQIPFRDITNAQKGVW